MFWRFGPFFSLFRLQVILFKMLTNKKKTKRDLFLCLSVCIVHIILIYIDVFFTDFTIKIKCIIYLYFEDSWTIPQSNWLCMCVCVCEFMHNMCVFNLIFTTNTHIIHINLHHKQRNHSKPQSTHKVTQTDLSVNTLPTYSHRKVSEHCHWHRYMPEEQTGQHT